MHAKCLWGLGGNDRWLLIALNRKMRNGSRNKWWILIFTPVIANVVLHVSYEAAVSMEAVPAPSVIRALDHVVLPTVRDNRPTTNHQQLENDLDFFPRTSQLRIKNTLWLNHSFASFCLFAVQQSSRINIMYCTHLKQIKNRNVQLWINILI